MCFWKRKKVFFSRMRVQEIANGGLNISSSGFQCPQTLFPILIYNFPFQNFSKIKYKKDGYRKKLTLKPMSCRAAISEV